MQSQKRQNDLCSFPRHTIQYHGNQVYAQTSNAEEAEVEGFYEDLEDLSELTHKKDDLFIIGDWNAKVGRQETPGVTGKSLLSRLKKIYMYYLPELALFSLFNIND